MAWLDEEKLLSNLGLTSSQVRVYLSLVQNGPSKVSQISKTSKIHRAHLYQILHTLEGNGLVERNLSDGTFIPTPLKAALEMLIEQKHKEVAMFEASAKTIMGSTKSELKTEKPPEISFLTNKVQILKKADSYSDSARKTIYLMHSWNRFLQLWANYSVTFTNAMIRGVTIKQVIECPEDKTQIQSTLSRPVFSNPRFEARIIPRFGGNFTIVDDEKMSISTSAEKLLLGDAPMLFSSYKGLLEVMKNYFVVTWDNAQNWNEL